MLLCGFMRCRHGLTPVYIMSGLSGNTVQWACATVMQLNYGFLVCVGSGGRVRGWSLSRKGSPDAVYKRRNLLILLFCRISVNL